MEYLSLTIVVIVVALALAWNFIPAWREKMRGMSTKLETAMGLILYQSGAIADAFEQIRGAGLLPDNMEKFAGWFIAGYIILKRLQTKTPSVGVE